MASRRTFGFLYSQAVALFAPEDDHQALREEVAAIDSLWRRRDLPLLDPIWGQERMIAAMSGIDEDQIGPFPEA
jgi:hypothetical protein